MKKLYTFMAALLMAAMLFAQSPQQMSYQAVVRDNNNNLITNTMVGIRISILQNSIPVYVETQKPITNSNGLITIAFGGETGFDAIDWSNGPFFIKSEIDPKGGNNYTITGTSQLMSVPYAFHAQTASYLVGDDNQILKSADKGVGARVWSQFGNANTDPLTDKLGTTDFADMVFVTNNMERLRIKSDGDINSGNLAVDGNLTVNKNVFLNAFDGSTNVGGDLTVENKKITHLTGVLQVDGNTSIKGETSLEGKATMGSDANFNGPVDFNDNVKIAKNLTVEGITTMKNDLSVEGIATLEKDLTVKGITTMEKDLTVEGISTMKNDLSVVGKANMKAADFSGQVTINANVAGGQASYGAYPLRVQGSNQGIAIKVNDARGKDKNFVTFWDSHGVQGRIEGETEDDIKSNPEYTLQYVLYAANVANNTFSLVSAGSEFVQAMVDLVGASSAVTVCAGLGAVVCSPPPSPIVAQIANVALKTALFIGAGVQEGISIADLINYEELKTGNAGVTYQSGAGDYAEWLPKADVSATFEPGQIIGVKNGQISLTTTGADHIFAVSTNPIILGNMPAEGNEANYAKIAFMGQVPVKVENYAEPGDYILASGNNDGMGVAVSPADMAIEDYGRIVGVAWSIKDPNGYANVAVGLTTNDLTGKVAEQAQEITDLRNMFLNVVGILKGYDKKLATALENIDVNPVPPPPDEEFVPSITYYKPKKEHIDEGLDMAIENYKNELAKKNEGKVGDEIKDPEADPVILKLKEMKNNGKFADDLDLAFLNEVSKKKNQNGKKGINTKIADLE